jgi:transposase
MNQELATLEQELAASFELHPDTEIYLSLPGLGKVLGARVMAEFGDDRTRFLNPKARKNFAGTAPITKSSGRRKTVLRRLACNHRLVDACYLWAFASLRRSPGAKHYTNSSGIGARLIPRRCVPSPTASSASFTAALIIVSSTERS